MSAVRERVFDRTALPVAHADGLPRVDSDPNVAVFFLFVVGDRVPGDDTSWPNVRDFPPTRPSHICDQPADRGVSFGDQAKAQQEGNDEMSAGELAIF